MRPSHFTVCTLIGLLGGCVGQGPASDEKGAGEGVSAWTLMPELQGIDGFVSDARNLLTPDQARLLDYGSLDALLRGYEQACYPNDYYASNPVPCDGAEASSVRIRRYTRVIEGGFVSQGYIQSIDVTLPSASEQFLRIETSTTDVAAAYMPSQTIEIGFDPTPHVVRNEFAFPSFDLHEAITESARRGTDGQILDSLDDVRGSFAAGLLAGQLSASDLGRGWIDDEVDSAYERRFHMAATSVGIPQSLRVWIHDTQDPPIVYSELMTSGSVPGAYLTQVTSDILGIPGSLLTITSP